MKGAVRSMSFENARNKDGCVISSTEKVDLSFGLHCNAEIRAYWVEQNLRSTTLNIITKVFHNAAFVCVHVVGRFSKDFSEVRGLRS